MSGRPPKPISQHISEGDPSRQGIRKLRQRLEKEPRAVRGLPSCPSHLKDGARKAWRFWSKELAFMNLDCRPDAQMLEGACVAYEAAVEAYETIQKQGRLVAKRILDPKTNELVVVNVKSHPAVAQWNAAWKMVKAFCSEFGLSPVARVRLAIERPGAGDEDLMAILSRPRAPRPEPPIETVQ